MAVNYSCDCCHHGIVGAPVERGIVIKRQYCATCLPDIDHYMNAVDVLHTKVAEAYREGRARLTEGFADSHKEIAGPIYLPDLETPVGEGSLVDA